MLTFTQETGMFISAKNYDGNTAGVLFRHNRNSKWGVYSISSSFAKPEHLRQIADKLDQLNNEPPQNKLTRSDDNANDLADMMERGPIPLHVLANRVCKDLPDGFVITIAMENGSAWIELINSNGAEMALLDAADKSLDEQVNDALCTARLSCGLKCTD